MVGVSLDSGTAVSLSERMRGRLLRFLVVTVFESGRSRCRVSARTPLSFSWLWDGDKAVLRLCIVERMYKW